MAVRNSIEVWIVRREVSASDDGTGERVLLLRKHARTQQPRPHPPFWQPVTGGRMPGERAEDAAAREVREETAIAIDPAELVLVAADVDVVVDAELTVRKQVFAVRTDTAAVALDGIEHDAASWTVPDEVEAALHWPSSRLSWARVRATLGI